MKARHWICLASMLLLAAAAPADESRTIYYAVFADGKKIGHAFETRAIEGTDVITTQAAVMTFTRGEVSVEMRQSETHVETGSGEPLGFGATQQLGPIKTTVDGKLTNDGQIELTVDSFGQKRQKTMVDWPKGALMSEGVRLLQQKKGLREGTTYSASMFSSTMRRAMVMKVKVGPTQMVDLLGRVVKLTELKLAMQSPTGAGEIAFVNYVDDEYNSQKVILPILGMTIEMIACDKAFALSKNDVVDFLDKCILKSPVPLEGLAEAKSATYTLQPTGSRRIRGIPSTDNQTVRPGEGKAVIVTVRLVKAPAGAAFPYRGKDTAALAALKPTQYVQSDRKEIIDLTRWAVGEAKDAATAARRIEAFVGKYIKTKSLSVGYASAAEVAASKEGDCSEHAVLTAAMCQAAGIPARVVMGYVYIPKWGKYTNVFGGHAWVEALIGDKWIYLDATRPKPGAGHVALAVGDGDPASFFDMALSMGYFKIAKVDIEK